MKLIIATATAALISTGAVYAEKSDRYNDLRLDTSQSSIDFSGDRRNQDADRSQRANDLRLNTAPVEKTPDFSFSTRNKTRGEGFIYGGFGPGNDSR